MDLVLNGALVCFGLVGVLFVALFAWAAHARRSEGEPDPEGVRTFATLRGGRCGPEELERIAEEGLAAAGGDLLQALVDALAEEGVEAADPVSRDGYGWGVLLGENGDAYLRLGTRSTGEIGEALPDPEEREWLLMLVDASGGGPGPREMLPPLHRALERLPDVESIRWFARHRFDQDEEDGGHRYPVDDEPTID